VEEKKCAQCGIPAVPEAKYCESCGAPLAAASQLIDSPAVEKPTKPKVGFWSRLFGSRSKEE